MTTTISTIRIEITNTRGDSELHEIITNDELLLPHVFKLILAVIGTHRSELKYHTEDLRKSVTILKDFFEVL